MERRGGVQNTGSMQLQLRERFCAREYANVAFVWAVDWPLHGAPGGERRGTGGLGRLCLAPRLSQASFSYTITVSSIRGKKYTLLSTISPRFGMYIQGMYREREASSISKLEGTETGTKICMTFIFELSLDPLKTGCNFGLEGLWVYFRLYERNIKLPYHFQCSLF